MRVGKCGGGADGIDEDLLKEICEVLSVRKRERGRGGGGAIEREGD